MSGFRVGRLQAVFAKPACTTTYVIFEIHPLLLEFDLNLAHHVALPDEAHYTLPLSRLLECPRRQIQVN